MQGMKTLTWTALLATVVAIPFLLHRRRIRLEVHRVASGFHPPDEYRRYDLYDFIS